MTVNKNYSLVLQKVNHLSFEDRPKPVIVNETDVIVQILATGICGSDVHFYARGRIGDFVVMKPLILGHESAGIVTKVGSEVTKVKVGDKVCLEPGTPCHVCRLCLGGQYNHCAKMHFAAAPPVDGTLTKYFKIAETFCYKLPDNVSVDEGALMEPLSVAVHAVREAKITPGSSVVVFGAGPVGLLVAAVARNAYGASLTVIVDINEERLKFAKENFGVETYLSVKGRTAKEAGDNLVDMFDLNNERGFEFAMDATGVPYCIQCALYSLRPRGTFVQIGMGADNAELPISTICFHELNLRGSFRYNGGDFEQAVGLVARGVVDVKKLISSKVKFSQAKDAFEFVRQGKGLKTLISGPE
ncbi:chaperonin 10-like protein [Lipomyces doorenjongii]|uniref:chaperonin 10-like protein n=1 Tax=Lipomyces doorenjongii TaxID=383834 RepID=UPI0034CD12CF